MTNGIPYFYVVSAYNTGGSSPTSDEAMAEPFVSPAAPTVTPNYGYSSDGMRAWKTVGGSTTYFLYDGSQPVCELDGTGAVTATNTWGGNLLSRRVVAASTFYTFDPSGNVAQRLDASANVLGTYAFDAFGLRTGTDATPDPYAGFGGGWGYYADAETGLSLLGHRYYDTGTGRFVTRDPIGYAGGADLYSYTQNNPVNDSDPLGYCGGKDGWNTAADFFGGFGHIASLGLTDWINNQSGANSVVDTGSNAYKGGEVAAVVNGLFLGGARSFSAGAKTVFWSGYSGGALTEATAYATSIGGRTLEQTAGGKFLVWLGNKGITVSPVVWDTASSIFARNAKGVATVFLRNPRADSTWFRIEEKILNQRGIIIVPK